MSRGRGTPMVHLGRAAHDIRTSSRNDTVMALRRGRRLIQVTALMLIAATVTWAVMTVLRQSDNPLAAPSSTFVSVEPGDVGSSLSLNTIAKWQPTPLGANQAAGIVTSVDVPDGQTVSQGTVLYTVDLRPVVVAQGDVPAFRAIGAGVRGRDVAQLQSMLQALGFFTDAVDGRARESTMTAISEWQESLGLDDSGGVPLGDVIFVPSLPTRVALDTAVMARGRSVSGGEVVLQGLAASPTFQIPVTDAQAAGIPTGTAVRITAPDGSAWHGTTTDQVRTDQTVMVNVAGVGEDVICGLRCDLVPVSGESRLTSEIVTVPSVSGLVVPSAALVTDAEGRVAVIDEAGARLPVTVLESARGMSVIDGAPQGTRVRVPGERGEG